MEQKETVKITYQAERINTLWAIAPSLIGLATVCWAGYALLTGLPALLPGIVSGILITVGSIIFSYEDQDIESKLEYYAYQASKVVVVLVTVLTLAVIALLLYMKISSAEIEPTSIIIFLLIMIAAKIYSK